MPMHLAVTKCKWPLKKPFVSPKMIPKRYDMVSQAYDSTHTHALPSQAMEELIKLKGIGPATASAILSLASAHENCPFLSDEAMRAFDIVNKAGKLDYTMATWASLTKACEEKAEELNKAGGDDETEDAVKWSPVKVERAIWADSVKQGKTES